MSIMRDAFNHTNSRTSRGFTLLDTLVGVFIFVLIALVTFQSYLELFRLVRLSTVKVTAGSIMEEELETIRNLPYASVGLQNGIPNGILPQNHTVIRNNKTFNVRFYVRNIDDPFDGTLGGSPNDTSPADYKMVEITISCVAGCTNFNGLSTTTTVAPKSLEGSSTNGALFIRVFDANGQPVNTASVHLTNAALNPAISYDDVTDQEGWLRIVDVPPSQEAYQITVTKSGYSTDRTYPPGAPSNPHPTNPHATVVAGGVTQVSFSIDILSGLWVKSLTTTCLPVSAVSFNLTGTKVIGVDPTVIKFNQNFSTDVSGSLVKSDLEWDIYNPTLTDSRYYLSGGLPTFPVELTPNTAETIKFILSPRTSHALLVEVLDAATHQPISAADVAVTGPGYSKTLITGEGYWQQTTWQGGSGQGDFSDPTQYYQDSGTIATTNPNGDVNLKLGGSTYAPDGWITSSSFDTGTSTNFYHLVVRPHDQPQIAGTNAVKLQIATNNDNATWNYIGPDGTPSSYYTLSDRTISTAHNGDRYIRYRIDLHTDDTSVTPNISDVAIGFATECAPAGQVYFDDVGGGDYTITVSKTGYQTYNGSQTIGSGWQKTSINLIPE